MASPSLKQWLKLPSVLKKSEKIFLGVLGFIFISSLVWFYISFTNNNTNIVPEFGGTHVEGIIGQPSSINPIYAPNSDAERMMTELIFSGLYKYDSLGQVVPDLALSKPEIKEGGTVYEIYFRDDALWHDLKPLTADDIIYTVRIMQDPEYKSSLRANWIGVTVEKISDHGVRFRLKNAYPDFLERLTFKVIPQHIWNDLTAAQFPFSPYNFKPIGSGPYQIKDFQDSIKQDNKGKFVSIRLTAFTKFHLGRPNIKTVIFNFYDDDKALIKAANEGKITGFVNRNNASLLNPSFASYKFLMPRYFALFFNTQGQNKILSNKLIRQALNYATNKADIINSVLKSEAFKVDSPILPDVYGYNAPEKTYDFNQDKAKEMLSKAGYKEVNGKWEKTEKTGLLTKNLEAKSVGEEVKTLQKCLISLNTSNEKIYPEEKITGTFDTATVKAVNRLQEKYRTELLDPDKISNPTGVVKARTRELLNRLCAPSMNNTDNLKISISTIDDAILKQVAQKIQEQWQAIGVETEVKIFSLSDLKQTALVPRNYDAVLFGEVLGSVPDPFPFWHSSQGNDPGLNLSVYKNEEVDKLLEKARQENDMAARVEKLEKAQNLIIDDAPAIFLYNPYNNYFANKNIKGIKEGNIVDIPKIFSDFNNWYINTRRAWKTSGQTK